MTTPHPNQKPDSAKERAKNAKDAGLQKIANTKQWLDVVQEAGEESFPASDPPSHTPIGGVGSTHDT